MPEIEVTGTGVRVDSVVWYLGNAVEWVEGDLLYRGYIKDISADLVMLAVLEVKYINNGTLYPIPTANINKTLMRIK